MNLYYRADSRTLEFDELTLVESGETYVYSFMHDGALMYTETVAEPTSRELIDACISSVNDEILMNHAARIREELDHGIF